MVVTSMDVPRFHNLRCKPIIFKIVEQSFCFQVAHTIAQRFRRSISIRYRQRKIIFSRPHSTG